MRSELIAETLRRLRAERRRVCQEIAAVELKPADHLSDHELERYHLGMVNDEDELAPLEEHLLACPECAERAEENAIYVDTMRAAIIAGGFDLER